MKRAQFSVEFLMITALAAMIIIPATFMMYTYSQKSVEEVSQTRLNAIGNSIISISQQVYYMGNPASQTITVNIPPGLKNISIVNTTESYELVFTSLAGSSYGFYSSVPIAGNFEESSWSDGQKQIKIHALETGVVNISIK